MIKNIIIYSAVYLGSTGCINAAINDPIEKKCLVENPGQVSAFNKCVKEAKKTTQPLAQVAPVAALSIDMLLSDPEGFLNEASKQDASGQSKLRFDLNKKYGAIANDDAKKIALSLHGQAHKNALAKKLLAVKGVIMNLPYPEKCSYTSTDPGKAKGVDADLEKMAQDGLVMKTGIIETFFKANNWVLTIADPSKPDGADRKRIENTGMTPLPQSAGKFIDQGDVDPIIKTRTSQGSTVAAWVGKDGKLVCVSQQYKVK